MIHVLDTRHLGRNGIIAATAVETDEGLILFDAGPESTFENVAAEIRGLGFAIEDVRHVFLSHIHFDHAGAAWRFAELGATIYVHPRGAAHLLDPENLVNSARRIFGNELQRLWGHVAPVWQDRIRVLQDDEVVPLRPLQIRAIETPGHASHHHIYHWDDTVFGGDVAGVRIGNGPPIPPLVPPELHVESWRESIAKIRALDPARLYLPHFGVVDVDVQGHLAALEDRVMRWPNWFRDRLRRGANEAELRRSFAELEHGELREGGATEADVLAYEQADPSYMAVAAVERYWRKFHPEMLA
jgi:glyoxylase-like metal-dependent hydrolase (beta-lactamase superfamily II)